MKKLGIDIDGVLCDSHSYGLLRFNNEHNTNFKKEDIYNYSFGKLGDTFGIDYTLKKFISYFNQDMHKYQFMQNSKTILKQLKEKGSKLNIITARSFDLKDLTKKWISSYFGENFFEDIIFYNQSIEEEICKSQICKKLGIELIIEDAPHYSKEISNANIHVLLMDQPWNRELKNNKYMKRIYSWNDVGENLLK